MQDIQSQKDERGVLLQEVGIKKLRLPVNIIGKKGTVNTVASFSLSVELPRDVKGTHMSRFIETIQEFDTFNLCDLTPLLTRLCEKLNNATSYLRMDFPYFLEKSAPATGTKSYTDIECSVAASLANGVLKTVLTLYVPIATLCPCSKAISKYGAHNQRTIVRIRMRPSDTVWIEELAALVERNASCDLYSLLKRPDEKFVTEKAYENPKFVEDVARDVFCELDKHPAIADFDVAVESQESIHNHNAYAYAKKEGSIFEY